MQASTVIDGSKESFDFEAGALGDRSADRLATLDRAKVAGTTFSSLLAAIGKLDPRDAKARARLFVELSNHLRFEDANAAKRHG